MRTLFGFIDREPDDDGKFGFYIVDNRTEEVYREWAEKFPNLNIFFVQVSTDV